MRRIKKVLLLTLSCLIILSGCGKVESPQENIPLEPSTSLPIEEQTVNDEPIVNTTNETLATIYFFDVGQADCTLIESGEDVILIDTGDIETKEIVLSYLDSLNISEIDYLILTHPHADHIGAAPEIITNYEIGEILMPAKITTTNIFERTLDSIANKEYQITVPEQGSTYQFENGSFTVLTDQNIDWGDDLNYSSLILKLSIGNSDFIFSGDADQEVEESVINAGYDLNAEVLKVGHHASYTASSDLFLQNINPEYAVISCGADNSYGHPHKEVIDKLNSRNIQYFRTDLSGTIVMTTDGNNIIVNAEPIVDFTDNSNDNDAITYILNTNSQKIHLESCQYAESISDKNRSTHTGNYDELLENGYTLCGSCMK